MNEPVIELDGVDKTYRFFRLSDVRLRLEPGQIMGFVGPNGAGKSTTIRILMAMVRPSAAPCVSSAGSCPGSRRQPSATSASFPRTCACTATRRSDGTCGSSPRFTPSGSKYAGALLARFNLQADQQIKAPLAWRARQGDLAARARQTSATAAPRRADHRPRSGRPARDPRGAHGRRPRRAPRDSVLVAQHAGHRAGVRVITFIDRGRIIDASDKETFLDRWRRLHLESPAGVALPQAAGVVDTTTSGRIAVVTTNAYTPNLEGIYERAGVAVRTVQRMTLEEIFVANVMNNRKEHAE